MIVKKESRIGHQILLLITGMEAEKKIERSFEELHLPIYYQCIGEGTASSELLNVCGLCGTKRLVTIAVLPIPLADALFSSMSDHLRLERKGSGIAVTIPVTGIQDIIRKILAEQSGCELFSEKEREVVKMDAKDSAYSMILVAANYGYSDEIIDAARKAGAKGGTIIKGRRRGSESVMQFLGVTMQEEQEFIIMVVPKDKKTDIMVEISRACGLKTSAHGVVLAIPVEDIMGVEK